MALWASKPSPLGRYERILQAARTVFDRLAYHGATIELIADAAGLSNGAVYYNFDNKEQLFVALLEQWRAQLIHDVESALGQVPQADLQSTLRSLMETIGPSREWRLCCWSSPRTRRATRRSERASSPGDASSRPP
jgi:AcrR family transcriptional regulator